MLLLLKHHIVTHTHSNCELCWWLYLQYLQYLQYPHWSVQCGAVHRPAVAVVSVSSKHCPWQHQHQPPHETPANGHCTVHVSAVHVSAVHVHVLLSRYVDIPLFTICALQYSDYVCNKTFNISCSQDDHPVCPRSGVLLRWLTVWLGQDIPRCDVVTYIVLHTQ